MARVEPAWTLGLLGAAGLLLVVLIVEVQTGLLRAAVAWSRARSRGEQVLLWRFPMPLSTVDFGWAHLLVTTGHAQVFGGLGQTAGSVALKDVAVVRHFEWHPWYRERATVLYCREPSGELREALVVCDSRPQGQVAAVLGAAGFSVEYV